VIPNKCPEGCKLGSEEEARFYCSECPVVLEVFVAAPQKDNNWLSAWREYFSSGQKPIYQTYKSEGVRKMNNHKMMVAKDQSQNTIFPVTGVDEDNQMRMFFRYHQGNLVEFDLTRYAGVSVRLTSEEMDVIRSGEMEVL